MKSISISALAVCLLTLFLAGTPLSGQTDVQEVWKRDYSSGLIPGIAAISDLALDNVGNVYIAGHVSNPPLGMNYLTAKYDPSGKLLWTAQYDGPSHGDDLAFAIAVDADGNAYVTGRSAGQAVWYDYATVKYDNSGAQMWVARYDGPANHMDEATSIGIDATGNIYVTGISLDEDTYYDYATIKYDRDGIARWVNRYERFFGTTDRLVSLALDAEGNVYVAGTDSSDYLTLKYDLNGVEQWRAYYDDSSRSFDFSTAMTVDPAGNVFLTGQSELALATVKYNTDGERQWVASYDEPGSRLDQATAITVDGSGNVYVTGISIGNGTSYDYITIKYDSTGEEEWNDRYNGPRNGEDRAKAIGIDEVGNVYVTGVSQDSGNAYSYATLKYDSGGSRIWGARFQGALGLLGSAAGLKIDRLGRVLVAGQSLGSDKGVDATVFKYDALGAELGTARYAGPKRSFDVATALTVDGDGNVYAVGESAGSDGTKDFATAKYNSTGELQWVVRYDGPAHASDLPKTIVSDGLGNVYVCGASQGDYVTIKYDAAGSELWVARYNAPANLNDIPSAFAVDREGNVYVTGESAGEYATIKYNSAGNEQWVVHYRASAGNFASATALAVDFAGNVCVTGTLGTDTGTDFLTIKYNSSGAMLWAKRYNGPNAFARDEAIALVVDEQGNVYVTGTSIRDYATIKYDAAGVEKWVARYSGPQNENDAPTALAVNRSGEVFVTGSSSRASGNSALSDFVTIKYDSLGKEQWLARFDGLENTFNFAADLILDAESNVYVSGSALSGPAGTDNCTTIKYSTAGVEQWRAGYNGVGGSTFVAAKLAVNASREVFLLGTSYDTGLEGDHGSSFTTIKYSQSSVWVQERDVVLPWFYHLSQNFPNPFSLGGSFNSFETAIEYELPQRAEVELAVYDLAGRRVATLESRMKEAGAHVARWNGRDEEGKLVASGIYFYRMHATTRTNQTWTFTRKLTVLR